MLSAKDGRRANETEPGYRNGRKRRRMQPMSHECIIQNKCSGVKSKSVQYVHSVHSFGTDIPEGKK